MSEFPTLSELAAQETELQLPGFTNDDAWALGSALVARAQAEQLPVAIEISRHSHQLFHAALPGATPDNQQIVVEAGSGSAIVRVRVCWRAPQDARASNVVAVAQIPL